MNYRELVRKVKELEKIVNELKPKEREKITLEEFWNNKEELAIHCRTEEQAKTLCKAFDRMGRRWQSGCRYIDKTNYWYYETETCYSNDGTYTEVENCWNCDIKIYKFEDIILPEISEEPKWTFTEDEKVILRNIDEKYRWIARDDDGDISISVDTPQRQYHSWKHNDSFRYLQVFNHLFKTIKWEDEKPCEFRKYIQEDL